MMCIYIALFFWYSRSQNSFSIFTECCKKKLRRNTTKSRCLDIKVGIYFESNGK